MGPGKPQDSSMAEVQPIIEMGGDPQNKFTSLVAGVPKAMDVMLQMLPQEGVAPEKLQKLSQAKEMYMSALKDIMGQGQEPAQPEAEGPGVVDANAGPGGVPLRG